MISDHDLTQEEKLLVEVDARLVEAMYHTEVQGNDDEKWDLDRAWRWMRWAYGRGYKDCFTDPDPERFYRETGYKAPPKRTS